MKKNNPITGAKDFLCQDRQEVVQMAALAGEGAHRVLFELKPRLLENYHLAGRIWHCCNVMAHNNEEGASKIQGTLNCLAGAVEFQERVLNPYGPAFFERYEKPRLYSVPPFADALMSYYGASHALVLASEIYVKPFTEAEWRGVLPSGIVHGLEVIRDHFGRIRVNGGHLAVALPLQMKMGLEDAVFGVRKVRCALEGGPV